MSLNSVPRKSGKIAIEETLDNGVRVLIKNLPHTRSVSMGIFLIAGLHQETARSNGIAHFLEHMSFKGTDKRTAKQITEEVDRMGGHINAYTSKEFTCYYLKILDHHIMKGLDLLSDIVLNSTIQEADVEMERGVILEEIKMYEDTPDDKIHDLFAQMVWPKTHLGWPIIGTHKTLERISASTLHTFKDSHYLNPKNIVITATGNIPSTRKLMTQIRKLFAPLKASAGNWNKIRDIPSFTAKTKLHRKKIEQVHFCMGTNGIPFASPDHYKLMVLNTILGGTMSSRLFQNIREKHGLAYSIYSYTPFYKTTGLFVISGGVTKKNLHKTIELSMEELHHLKREPVSKAELEKAKEQLKGQVVLGLETPGSWMGWLTKSKLYWNRLIHIEEVLAEIEAVTVENLQKTAQYFFKPQKIAFSAIGPFTEKETIDLTRQVDGSISRLSER